MIRSCMIAILFLAACGTREPPKAEAAVSQPPSKAAASGVSAKTAVPEASPTSLRIHNVILDEHPIRLRVKWLRGTIHATRPGTAPSLDDPGSFGLNIEAAGKQIRMTGTIHKGLPVPFEMISDVDASSDGRVHFHIARIHVLKIPVTGLLKTFHVDTADIIDTKGVKGIEVKGDDVFIDPEQVLPEPRKSGKLTDVHLRGNEIIEIYGSGHEEAVDTKQWRNFLWFQHGTLSFGRLTMAGVDLMLIDTSPEKWFTFGLATYQKQLVRGYMRMTEEGGLRVFLPPLAKAPPDISNRTPKQLLKKRPPKSAEPAVKS